MCGGLARATDLSRVPAKVPLLGLSTHSPRLADPEEEGLAGGKLQALARNKGKGLFGGQSGLLKYEQLMLGLI